MTVTPEAGTYQASKIQLKGFSHKEWSRLKSEFYDGEDEQSNESCSSDDSAVSISWISLEENLNKAQNTTKIPRHVVTRLNFDDCVIQTHRTPHQKRAKIQRLVLNRGIGFLNVNNCLLDASERVESNKQVETEVNVDMVTNIKHKNKHTNREAVINNIGHCMKTETFSRAGKSSCFKNAESLNEAHTSLRNVPHVETSSSLCISSPVADHVSGVDDLQNKETCDEESLKISSRIDRNDMSSPLISMSQMNIKMKYVNMLPSAAEERSAMATSPVVGSCRKHLNISLSPVIGSHKKEGHIKSKKSHIRMKASQKKVKLSRRFIESSPISLEDELSFVVPPSQETSCGKLSFHKKLCSASVSAHESIVNTCGESNVTASSTMIKSIVPLKNEHVISKMIGRLGSCNIIESKGNTINSHVHEAVHADTIMIPGTKGEFHADGMLDQNIAPGHKSVAVPQSPVLGTSICSSVRKIGRKKKHSIGSREKNIVLYDKGQACNHPEVVEMESCNCLFGFCDSNPHCYNGVFSKIHKENVLQITNTEKLPTLSNTIKGSKNISDMNKENHQMNKCPSGISSNTSNNVCNVKGVKIPYQTPLITDKLVTSSRQNFNLTVIENFKENTMMQSKCDASDINISLYTQSQVGAVCDTSDHGLRTGQTAGNGDKVCVANPHDKAPQEWNVESPLFPAIESVSSQESAVELLPDKELVQGSSRFGQLMISQQTSPTKSNETSTNVNMSQEEGMQEPKSPPYFHQTLYNVDSAKKKKRIKKNGLAGRLQKLLTRQQSSARMWQHELSTTHNSSQGTLLRVNKVWVECGRVLVLCNSNCSPPVTENKVTHHPQTVIENQESCSPISNEEELTCSWVVILDAALVPPAQLRHGSVIKLYPPWQTLKVSRLNLRLLLSITHLVLVEAGICVQTAPPPPNVDSFQEFTCPCLSERNLQHKCGVGLPRQGSDLLRLLFPYQESRNNMKPTECQLLNVGGDMTGQNGTVVEAVTSHNNAFIGSIWLQLVILRIFCYRQCGSITLPSDEQTEDSAHDLTWSVLGKDVTGETCEVILGSPLLGCNKDGLSEEWNSIMSGKALGCVYKFTGLTVVKKMSGTVISGLLASGENFKKGAHEDASQMFLYVLSVTSKMWEMTCIKCSNVAHPRKMENLLDILKQMDMQCSSHHSILVKVLTYFHGCLYVTDTSLCQNDDKSCTSPYLKVHVKPLCFIPCKVSTTKRNVIYLQDVQLYRGELYANKYSRVLVPNENDFTARGELFSVPIDGDHISSTFSLQPELQHLCVSSVVMDLVIVKGEVIQVDEDTAYGWPCCVHCSNDLLCEIDNTYHCQNCGGPTEVYTKMSLDIFLKCPNLPLYCNVKVKLQQESIEALLPPTQNDGKGYEMDSVLNKVVGPLVCVVLTAKASFKGDKEKSIHFVVEEVPLWEDQLHVKLQEIKKLCGVDSKG